VINRAESESVVDVPRQAFSPPPQVASGVVRLIRRAQPLVRDEERFFRVARAAFEHRRKMAAGTLSRVLHLPREKVDSVFAESGLESTARPENLPFSAWARLAELLG
jgi:16S rRNA (adenine1518-N6/adenine1519-N6)-dimethyltransferase